MLSLDKKGVLPARQTGKERLKTPQRVCVSLQKCDSVCPHSVLVVSIACSLALDAGSASSLAAYTLLLRLGAEESQRPPP